MRDSKRKDKIEPPPWVLSNDDAREAFENAFRDVDLAVSLTDDDLIQDYRAIGRGYWDNFMLAEDAVAGLVALEKQIEEFRRTVASRYRAVVQSRIRGADISVGEAG